MNQTTTNQTPEERVTNQFNTPETNAIFDLLLETPTIFSTLGDLSYQTGFDIQTIESALREIKLSTNNSSYQLDFNPGTNSYRLNEIQEKVVSSPTPKNLNNKHNFHRFFGIKENSKFEPIGHLSNKKGVFTMSYGLDINFGLPSNAQLFHVIQSYGQVQIPMEDLISRYNDLKDRSTPLANDNLRALKQMISAINGKLADYHINNLRIACFVKEELVVIETNRSWEA